MRGRGGEHARWRGGSRRVADACSQSLVGASCEGATDRGATRSRWVPSSGCFPCSSACERRANPESAALAQGTEETVSVVCAHLVRHEALDAVVERDPLRELTHVAASVSKKGCGVSGVSGTNGATESDVTLLNRGDEAAGGGVQAWAERAATGGGGGGCRCRMSRPTVLSRGGQRY